MGTDPTPVALDPGRTRTAPIPSDGPPTARRTPFHVLAKPTGPICNLDCEYCFFLSKEALYPGDRFRMSEDVLRAYLAQLLGAHPDGDVTVAWQGGEPTLMGVDFFRRAVALVEELRRPGNGSSTPSRPTARSSPTSGASCWPGTGSWSASASTGRPPCTTPTGWTSAALPPRPRCCTAWSSCRRTVST